MLGESPTADSDISPQERQKRWLRAQVALSGLSQREIGERAGLPVYVVCRVLAGVRRTPEHQKRIAAVLGEHPRVLFGDLCHPSLSEAA